MAHQLGRRLTALQTGRVYDYGASFLLSALVFNVFMGFSGIEIFTIAFGVLLIPYRAARIRAVATFFQRSLRTIHDVFVAARPASFSFAPLFMLITTPELFVAFWA